MRFPFNSIQFNSIWNICKIYSIFSGNVPTIHFVTRFILWILVHEIHNKLLFIAHTCVINTAHYTSSSSSSSSSCVENRPFFLCQSSISNINGIYIVCISLCMKTSIWHLQTHLRYTGPLHTHTVVTINYIAIYRRMTMNWASRYRFCPCVWIRAHVGKNWMRCWNHQSYRRKW